MSRDTGSANLTISAAFIDELARCGVRHAVICPGSRSTPLAIALAAHPDIRLWVHIDERSAAFFALGIARRSRAPVAILSTSGTAAANFLPAVAEGSLSRAPLIALTADRPPEARGWGAAQTIDQLELYGSHAKWFADLPPPDTETNLVAHARAVAALAVQEATSDPSGPVHINVPFREPLLPLVDDPLETVRRAYGEGSDQQIVPRPRVARIAPAPEAIDDLVKLVRQHRRGIVVCGPGAGPGLPDAVARFAAAAGYPVLADPLSGVRFGPHDRSRVVDAYDPFLRDADTASALQPDLVIRTGAIPTSKSLLQFLAMNRERPHVLLDAGSPRDPDHLATSWIRGDPGITLESSAQALEFTVPQDSRWLTKWIDVDRATGAAVDRVIGEDSELFEGRVAAEIAAALPAGGTIVAGNSMPVRDIDAFVRGDQRDLSIVGNRGANGIDGVVSTALGVAVDARGPVVLLIGDLSFYHDLNGLLAARRFGLNLVVVVINNNGGGIFSFLPQAERLDGETFELLFGTPVDLDIAGAARLYGLAYARPRDWPAFRRDLCRGFGARGVSVIEVVTDRQHNVAQHRAIWTSVSVALRSSAAGR